MKKSFLKIGDNIIGDNKPVFIIAEAGVNHNNKLKMALDLVDIATQAGANAIKFQTFRAEDVVVATEQMAPYQKKNTRKSATQLKMLKSLELNDSFYAPIVKRCKQKKILFLSTPHGGFQSVDFLQKLHIPAFKFGSGDLANIPVLEYAARLKKPMILGTGMATMIEVRDAVMAIKRAGNSKIVALQCTTNYPCPFDEVNLVAMQAMSKELDVLIGYSDHTLGSQASIIATALGACVIEKHFTLNKKLSGPDHQASLDPKEFKDFVEDIRSTSVIMGSEIKRPTSSEMSIIKKIRKSIVSQRFIHKDEIFSNQNISIKRPGTGLPPKKYYYIIGKKAKRDIKKDSIISFYDF